jgi:hypothetical protein
MCVAAAILASTPVLAADRPAPPSDDLLAYLGSLDGKDDDWMVAQDTASIEARPAAPATVAGQQTRRPLAERGAKAPQEQRK